MAPTGLPPSRKPGRCLEPGERRCRSDLEREPGWRSQDRCGTFARNEPDDDVGRVREPRRIYGDTCIPAAGGVIVGRRANRGAWQEGDCVLLAIASQVTLPTPRHVRDIPDDVGKARREVQDRLGAPLTEWRHTATLQGCREKRLKLLIDNRIEIIGCARRTR